MDVQDRINAALASTEHPFSVLNNLLQIGALQSLEKQENGSNHTVTIEIKIQNSLRSHSQSATSLKGDRGARRLAAQQALDDVVSYLSTSPPTELCPPTRASLPTDRERLLMEVDQHHVALLPQLLEKVYRNEPGTGLLSIDLEMYERNHAITLEIGIACIDARDCMDPSKKQVFHLVNSDQMHLSNGKTVPNNRANFIFGRSRDVKQDDLGIETTTIIQELKSQYDNIILVGHSVEGDLKWLSKLQVQLPSDMAVLDIARAYRAMVSPDAFQGSVGMESMLQQLDVAHWYTHNGGNDAAYNLEVVPQLIVMWIYPWMLEEEESD